MELYRNFFKRLIDVLLSCFAFCIISPVFLIISGLLFFSNNGHPFFLQIRPGKKEKLFRIIKFKTMNDKKDVHANLLPDEKRLTALGKFIRKTSLDEIPQLLNVIKGDMSLVGPRPLLAEYLPLYSQTQNRRHDVKPGITGLAQVNGRNAITWKQKFEYDIWYIDHISFGLDLKILWLTFAKVLKSEGINEQNSATIEKFTGNT